MKISSYTDKNGVETWGIYQDDKLLCMPTALQTFAPKENIQSVLDLIKLGTNKLETIELIAQKAYFEGEEEWFTPLESAQLKAPVPIPESIRDFMLFEKHILECIRQVGLGKLAPFDRFLDKQLNGKSIAHIINKNWSNQPSYYKGNRFTTSGHNETVTSPSKCQDFDFELEFGIYLCGTGTNIKSNEAKKQIFGATLFNDFSARDIQLAEQKNRLGPAKGKDFNGGNAMGPFLVTMDEIDDLYNIDFEVQVNNELFGGGNSRDMHWSFEEVIEYVSRSETLYPGEFFGSGTITGDKGHGCGLETGEYLKDNDTVELSADIFGTLRNKVRTNT